MWKYVPHLDLAVPVRRGVQRVEVCLRGLGAVLEGVDLGGLAGTTRHALDGGTTHLHTAPHHWILRGSRTRISRARGSCMMTTN